eukprot:scaffold3071_cov88-Isochrysis_galbana.AAC.1
MDSSSGCDSPPSARRPTACSPLEVRSRSTVSVASCDTCIASRTAAARWDRLPAAPPASGTYSSLPPDSRGSCASEATSTNGFAGPAAAGATTSRTAICASEHARPNSRSGAFSGRARRSSAATSSAPPATGGSARSPRAYPAEAPETERMTTSAENPATTARATSTAAPNAAPSDAGARQTVQQGPELGQTGRRLGQRLLARSARHPQRAGLAGGSRRLERHHQRPGPSVGGGAAAALRLRAGTHREGGRRQLVDLPAQVAPPTWTLGGIQGGEGV